MNAITPPQMPKNEAVSATGRTIAELLAEYRQAEAAWIRASEMADAARQALPPEARNSPRVEVGKRSDGSPIFAFFEHDVVAHWQPRISVAELFGKDAVQRCLGDLEKKIEEFRDQERAISSIREGFGYIEVQNAEEAAASAMLEAALAISNTPSQTISDLALRLQIMAEWENDGAPSTVSMGAFTLSLAQDAAHLSIAEQR